MAYTTYRVPTTIFEDVGLLNKNPLQVYLALGKFHNTKELIVYQTSADIASLIIKHDSHVRRALSELEGNFFIISDIFKNISNYPIQNSYYESNQKFYILPDYLIMDIENGFNKGILNKEAVVLLRYCMNILNDRTNLVRNRTKNVQTSTKTTKRPYHKNSSSVPNHYTTLLSYYNKLLEDKLNFQEKENKKTGEITYNITIKNSFNKIEKKVYTKKTKKTSTTINNEIKNDINIYHPNFDWKSIVSFGIIGPFYQEVLKDFQRDQERAKEFFLDKGFSESQIHEARKRFLTESKQ